MEVKTIEEVKEVEDRKLLVGRDGLEVPLTEVEGVDRLESRDGVCLLA